MHYGMAKFVDEEASKGSLVIATERLVPLTAHLKTLSRDEFLLGLFQIVETVHFLHTSVEAAHCAITADTVYVRPDAKGMLSPSR